MTDEQLGRAWCERNGKRPDHYPRTGLPPWRWTCDDGPTYALPYEVWDRMAEPSRYETEAAAYAAVGAALRELVADSDELRRIADEVKALEGQQ